jgi:hypothetical protein
MTIEPKGSKAEDGENILWNASDNWIPADAARANVCRGGQVQSSQLSAQLVECSSGIQWTGKFNQSKEKLLLTDASIPGGRGIFG